MPANSESKLRDDSRQPESDPGGQSSLRAILEKARAGDEDARNELFSRCRAYLNVIAQSQLETWMTTKVDTSDLIQQTMLEAHRGFEKFRGNSDGEWLAWLRQILQNNTVDLIRHYKGAAKRDVSRERIASTMAGENDSRPYFDPELSAATPSGVVMQHEAELELAAAIEQLNDDYRRVIILRSLQRMPFDEVAERMDRSRTATQMLWTRAVKQLEKHLNSRGQHAPDET